jgi:hypothetical protein
MSPLKYLKEFQQLWIPIYTQFRKRGTYITT